jgi:hypothetical protein
MQTVPGIVFRDGIPADRSGFREVDPTTAGRGTRSNRGQCGSRSTNWKPSVRLDLNSKEKGHETAY